MKGLSDILAEAYAAWLDSVSACCAPLASCLDSRKPTRRGCTPSPYTGVNDKVGAAHTDESLSRAGTEKHMEVLHDQPELVSPPSADPLRQHPTTAARQRGGKGFSSAGSAKKGGFSARRRFGSNASSRRPHISAPSNFRHVYSESFQFPQQQQQRQRRQRPASFRPLELSIYVAEKPLSPILPHFGHSPSSVSPPPPVHTASSRDDDSSTLAYTKSYSSTMSFHIPRRQLSEEGSVSSSSTDAPPRIPPRSRGRGRGRGRARAHTSPSVDGMVERIASAMIERDKLQAEIESLMERQSIYVNSRPSTAYSIPEDIEPMPSVPALPAAAPSFAERLSFDRPHTSPSRVQEPLSTALATPPRRADPAVAGEHSLDRPLAPPLPLVLRPPLRKKKSFSRVSSWLFPSGGEPQHSRDISLESVTNAPRPVARGDGFYQCMTPPGERRGSAGSSAASTTSGWESQEDERTVPTTTWSPGSSPATTRPEMPTPSSTVSHVGTFGCGRVQAPRPTSVGVAF